MKQVEVDQTMNKPLAMATLGDLVNAITLANRESVLLDSDPQPTFKPTKTVYGVQGIANELKISKSTAWRFLAAGKLDGAITRIGKTIVADADALWAVFRNNQMLKYAHQYPKRA